MLSFAITAGEGTLIAYGTVTYEVFDGLMEALEAEYGSFTDALLTCIIGPADGTGE